MKSTRKAERMTSHTEDERYQRSDVEMPNSTPESQISSFSSRLDKVESAIAKLESRDNAANQVSPGLQSVNDQLEAMADTLKATAGYNIRKTFECSSCMAKGVVAIKVTCAKCGKETWWGWWPGTKPTL